MARLLAKLEETVSRKKELEDNSALCMARLDRAFRLINGLSGESVRWKQSVEVMKVTLGDITGNILISAGAIAYLAPFTEAYRNRLLIEWVHTLDEYHITHSQECRPVEILGDPVQVRIWQLQGLPRDSLSTENAILVSNSTRWPLFIDPQGQANRWIKNMSRERNLKVMKPTDKDLMREMERALTFGWTVLIENLGTSIDQAMDPILNRQTFIQNGELYMKLGDSVIPYNNTFKLYLTTKMPNPHYMPEVSVKVLVVNFALVPSGLQDQLLAEVVMQERPDLEEARSRIIVSSAQMRSELKEIETKILQRLAESQGNPVDDIDLITTLEESKSMSSEIRSKVESSAETQSQIDAIRLTYIPVAERAQILFFCVADLGKMDPMYQYSLEWFTRIFIDSMDQTEKNPNVPERIQIINDFFTFELYSRVCRSLFEKNKLQFAFLLCIRILLNKGDIDPNDWTFFLAGGSPVREISNPVKWLTNRSWTEILSLENLPIFKSFVESFIVSYDSYKHIIDSTQPHREPLPQPWNSNFDAFHKMVIVKCLRPDKVTNCMQDFLSEHLGQQFIEPQTSDLAAMYKDSSVSSPLVFILSPGTDPAAELYKFADKLKMTKRLSSISLGQGQGPIAEAMFLEAREAGGWVFFQNCHLAPSWMPRLEYLVENIIPDSVHKAFRVWLTSTPSPHFPVTILQNGSKLTIEPPRGVKANLLKSYSRQVPEFSEFLESDNSKVQPFKWLLFSLCLFHGVCLERRKFGPLGFNIPYEFTDGDLRICISQLHMFLLEYEDVPFKVLSFTAGQINYGGRVTDDWDRRCLMNLLADYYNPTVLSDKYAFDENKSYCQLAVGASLLDYVDYIKALPMNDTPGLFGLHDNADISCAQAETYTSLAVLLSLQSKQAGGQAASPEEVTANLAHQITSLLPKPFPNIDQLQKKYPVMYEESLNTVLIQEVVRFNKLLAAIHSSLEELLKALQGLVVMSESLEKMSESLFTNKVPAMWAAKAYPSLKPLGAWVTDLQMRIDFINGWINGGIPSSFWISGFYFPQAFLTACQQNFARKYIVSIDSLSYKFTILKEKPSRRPDDGCVVYGLFLEGARWDFNPMLLAESLPKQLYTSMPPIWFVPEQRHKKLAFGIYDCPVYKTLQRAGTLSTTGHSTNYVLTIEVPTDRQQAHWIKRGVALFCALDY
ncbi:hypothetical protein AAG570_008724 [Ranatra chinensis]|uniref:Dynein heavy chain n=1 Tax=Ranatra chinensis TaxID=642074 RepID=A0ABD0YRU0_9HEMI